MYLIVQNSINVNSGLKNNRDSEISSFKTPLPCNLNLTENKGLVFIWMVLSLPKDFTQRFQSDCEQQTGIAQLNNNSFKLVVTPMNLISLRK